MPWGGMPVSADRDCLASKVQSMRASEYGTVCRHLLGRRCVVEAPSYCYCGMGGQITLSPPSGVCLAGAGRAVSRRDSLQYLESSLDQANASRSEAWKQ